MLFSIEISHLNSQLSLSILFFDLFLFYPLFYNNKAISTYYPNFQSLMSVFDINLNFIEHLKKIAIIYKSLYIKSNKLYNKLSGGHLWQIL